MKIQILAGSLVLGLLLASCQQAPPALAPDFAFVKVNVIDVTNGNIKPDQIVMIQGDKIVATGDFATTTIPKDVATVFAEGQFLMPGLMDSHVHAFQSIEAATQSTLPLFVAHGVTRIRDMGTELERLKLAQNTLTDSPNLIHPVIISTGPMLDSQQLAWYGDLQMIISDPSEASEMVTKLEANGIGQLKVYTNLKPDVYHAISQQARTRGLRLVGHVPIGVSLTEVAEARQLSIEHLDVPSMVSCAKGERDWFAESVRTRFSEEKESYFNFMALYWSSLDWTSCEKALQSISKSGTYWTPTLVMETTDAGLVDSSALGYLTSDARSWCESDLDSTRGASPSAQHAAYTGLRQTLDKIRAAGVPLLAGSDSPNHCLVPGASLIWELVRMVDFGLTNLEAIQSATLNPAVAFTGKQRLVKTGDPAELLLLGDNPLENLQALKNLEGVYVQGRWFGRTALDDMKASVRRYVENQTSD